MKNTCHQLAIIMPAYNEELTIADVIRDFHEVKPEALIVVIDNNSKDATSKIVLETFEELGVNGKLLFEPRQGKANAVRRAFHEIDANFYVMVDADRTYPASSIDLLLEPAVNGSADMVVGDRHSDGHYGKENKRALHGFGNELVRVLINFIFSEKLKDILSGYRVFTRRFIKTYPILIRGFELETDLTLHALDKRMIINEIPIEYKDRPEGSFSKLNTVQDGMRVLQTILHILRHNRPLQFFGGLAIFTALMGFLAGLPAILDYIYHSYVYHIPLAILASSLMLVAILLLITGLILDTIARFHRIEFEIKLLNWKNDEPRS